jgi:phospholipid/cholesterol/gamma-HCH transport system substrate-binding protein
MEQRPQYLLVGSFVLILVALGVIFVLWFSKVNITGYQNLYEIYFTGTVTGLRENEEIMFRGIPIGKVIKISVSKIDPDKVRVLVSINKPELIREDTIAVIEAQGLTGYAFVQIKGSTKESPILKALPGRKYPIINSQPSDIESLFDQLPRILKNTNAMVKKLTTILDEKTMNNIRQTFDHIHQISRDLSEGPGSVKLAIQSIKEDFQKIKEAADNFSKSLDSFEQLVEENRTPILNFTQQGLPELTRLILKSQATMESIKRVTDRLEKGPAEFFSGGSKGGFKIECIE